MKNDRVKCVNCGKMFSSGKNKCPQCGTRFVDFVGMETRREKVVIRARGEKERGGFTFIQMADRVRVGEMNVIEKRVENSVDIKGSLEVHGIVGEKGDAGSVVWMREEGD